MDGDWPGRWCAPCKQGQHEDCDGFADRGDCGCSEGACRERLQGERMTTPEQTDNTERPEDGEQDVDQSAFLDYSVDDDAPDAA